MAFNQTKPKLTRTTIKFIYLIFDCFSDALYNILVCATVFCGYLTRVCSRNNDNAKAEEKLNHLQQGIEDLLKVLEKVIQLFSRQNSHIQKMERTLEVQIKNLQFGSKTGR